MPRPVNKCRRRPLSAGFVFVGLFAAAVAAQQAPAPADQVEFVAKKPWGHPNLEGTWTSATVTPLERPKELADKPFLTEEEAAEYARTMVERRNVDARRTPGNSDVTSAYNDHWYDRGTTVVSTRRTSLIIDPPNGRIPPLTPEGQKRAATAIPQSGIQEFRIVNSWLDRGIWERCITRGVPDVMLPTAYNNNYQIFQTPDHVAILAEMIHDVRLIPLDGRPALPSGIRQWMGSSRGRWEGDTLVVETRNFTAKTSFRGSRENLHLVERFRRVDEDTLLYQVTIDDPTTFTSPWTIELPATRADGPVYEYACHEGNYAMRNLLSASRAAEKEAAQSNER